MRAISRMVQVGNQAMIVGNGIPAAFRSGMVGVAEILVALPGQRKWACIS